jgi:hypothetical protein
LGKEKGKEKIKSGPKSLEQKGGMGIVNNKIRPQRPGAKRGDGIKQ